MHDSRPLEDPAEIERSHRLAQSLSLRWVLLSVALMMLGMAAADHLLSPPGESRSYISLSMGTVALLSYWLVRSDRRKWESPLMVTGVMVATTWAVYSYGSVRAASTFAFLGAVVMAGTYLRLRALWITTLSGVLLLGVLTWAEASGHLPRATLLPDLRYWLMGSVIILLIGAQLYHTRKATDEVYLRHLSQMEERLRLEHERDQSMRRFRRIFVLNPTALLVQTANSQAVVEVNPAFERRFGYRDDQIVGQHDGRPLGGRAAVAGTPEDTDGTGAHRLAAQPVAPLRRSGGRCAGQQRTERRPERHADPDHRGGRTGRWLNAAPGGGRW